MSAVIRDIRDYRLMYKPQPSRWTVEMWVCGSCQGRAWKITSGMEVRCTHCNTRAANLQVTEVWK